MTGTPANLPDTPEGADLDALRDEIDELKNTPTEELVSPVPHDVEEREPTPTPTDPIGGEEDPRPTAR